MIPWQIRHGRQDLPWQHDRTPYRVWISEIMLQQTQVETVKSYYLRFMHALPTLADLAASSEEQVLQLWTGLGYYARARHLHHAAQMIMTDFGGKFPETLDELITLKGIGRSTAGAILSLAMGKSAPILDGNVKRVLSRVSALNVWPGEASAQKQLWEIATQHTPKKEAAIYNQAMMDLGAMICTRKAPRCPLCPLRTHCLAYQQQQQELLPLPKPRRVLPQREAFVLVLWNEKNNQVLLEKRPAPGIWGGLWCFPECPRPGRALNAFLPKDARYVKSQPVLSHLFSHYRWDLTPVIVSAKAAHVPTACLPREHVWYNIDASTPLALAAVVKKLLREKML